MTHNIPNLTITTLDDGNLRLESKSFDECVIVDLHPIQVRYLAELVGLAPNGQTSGTALQTVGEQARDIDRLKRNMLRLREHTIELQDLFRTGADWKHADLSFEMGLINKLVDMMDMAVDEFADDYTKQDFEEKTILKELPPQQGESRANKDASGQLELEVSK